MKNPRVQTLIDTIELTHNLALYYMAKMEEEDPLKVFSTDDKEFNSLYWLVGHLAWAENHIILKGTDGKPSNIPWLENFSFGKPQTVLEEVSYEELKSGLEELHLASITHLSALNDEDLEKPNKHNYKFGQEPTNYVIIMHHIRHLGTHVGHLGWLYKMYGV